MASPYRAADDENIMPSRASDAPNSTPNRKPLANVSTNARVSSPAPGIFGKKVMAGSPLKRSFTAAVEGGQGFTYFKRRRFSGEHLGQTGAAPESRTRWLGVEAGHVSRSRSEPRHVMMPPPTTTVVPPSPTELNTPSDSGEESQGSSAERGSFSSLINYDPSSQPAPGSQAAPVSQQTAEQASSKFVFKTVSHAEMLRLRLRVAMYKIRTNQIDVPFGELQVESGDDVVAEDNAVEQAVATLRQEARDRMPENKLPVPKLLPGPVLLPTAYSSRLVYENPPPSSPSADSPERSSQQTRMSSSLGGVDRLVRAGSADSTSSVVRGRVAEGLLGLRNAS